MNKILLFSLCIIPSLILMWYVYIKDKVEKEPWYLLALLFTGGIMAANISLLISLILKRYLVFLNTSFESLSILEIIFKYLIAIALVEEGSKWLINYITIWSNKNFKHMYDPIVYSVFVALGFAAYENIVYVLAYQSNRTLAIVMRSLISVPTHAVLGIFMGYYLSLAKNALMFHKYKAVTKYKILSLLVPILLHFLYDILLINKSALGQVSFNVYLIICFIIAYLKLEKLAAINTNLKEKNISKK